MAFVSSPMRVSGLAITSLLLATALGAAAHAQQAPAQGPALNFVREPGAESCIASVELARLIEARLGKPVFVAAPQAVVAIEGSVRPDPAGGFVAVIAVSDGRGALYGSRELRVEKDCRELDEALALVIAVTLRPEGGAVAGIALPEDVARSLEQLFGDEPTDPEPESLPAAQASAPSGGEATAEPAAKSAAPATSAENPWSLAIEPAFFVVSGVHPDAAFGPALALRLGKPEYGSARVQGALALPTALEVPDEEAGEATFLTYAAALAYCSPELMAGPVGMALCPGLKLGVTTVDAELFTQDNWGASQTWFAFQVTATARVPLFGPVAAYLALYAEGRLARVNLRYIDAGGELRELFRADPVGAGAELGAVLTVF